MSMLRQVNPSRLRTTLHALSQTHAADVLIDDILVPVRQRLSRDKNTARVVLSLLDGVLVEFATSGIAASREQAEKMALLIAWENDDRTHLWLEAWRLAQQGWRIDVLAEPLDSPHPEFFPGQHLFVWTGKPLTRSQSQQLAHWREQGFAIAHHSGKVESL